MKAVALMIAVVLTCSVVCAQKLDQTFCGLHLGCSISEAKELMAGTVLLKEEDGFQAGIQKLIYKGNIHHEGASRTTLSFFMGSLKDIHIDYAPPYDSFEVFQRYKVKLEKKYGKMRKVDSKTLKYDYEVISEGMRVGWLWTENHKGAKYIYATHIAIQRQAFEAWKKEMEKRKVSEDGLGDF